MIPDSIQRGAPYLWGAAAAFAVAAIAHVAWHRFSRYEVAGESMAPTYLPGDYLVVDRWAYHRRRPRRGHVVLALDPRDPSRTLLKRVAHVDPFGGVTLTGDNPAASTDSRQFGPVGRRAIIARAIWRYRRGGRW